MRDVDDRYAARLQPPDQREQRVGLFLGQRRGRLVHHEDAGVLAERLGDLDHLAQADAEPFNRGSHVDLHAEFGHDRLRPTASLAIAQQGAARRARLAVEKDVLGDAERRHETEFLEDHRDPGALGVDGRDEMGFLALDGHGAGVLGVDPGQDLHQRRFARPVAAHQGVDFAAAQRELGAPEHANAAERLLDPLHLQNVRLGHGASRRIGGCEGKGAPAGRPWGAYILRSAPIAVGRSMR